MKRKLFPKALMLGMFALCACANSNNSNIESISVDQNPIKELSLAHAPTKANYEEGEYFSRSGLVIEALFKDGTRKAVHSYTLSPSGPLSSDVDELTASYSGFEVAVPISVSGKNNDTDPSFSPQAKIESDEEARYRVEAENAYYATPLSSSQLKDHSTRNKETSNLGSVGEFAVDNPMIIALESKVDADVSIAFSLAYNATTSIDANYEVVWNGADLITNIVVEAGSDPYPYYTWKEYVAEGLSLQKGRNTLSFGVKSSSSAKINVDYVDFLVSPASEKPSPVQEEEEFAWGSLNEDYKEEVIGKASSALAPNGIDHPENDIHSDLQYRYLSSGYNTVSSFASGSKEESKSRGLSIDFDYLAGEEGPYFIEVSKSADFASSEIFESEETVFHYPNPLLDQNYYYRVDTSKEGLALQKAEIAYSSSLGPRNLDIDGVTNVRDLGGYTSKLGGMVRQGLYYRGGRLNKSEQNTFALDITEKGIEELSFRLGVNSEIDLRMNDSGDFPSHRNEFGFIEDGMIDGIAYHNCPLDWTQSDMMKESRPMIGEIFHLLADKDNYPVYLHCNIGTDRTGMISYLLGCLLGIPQEDLYRDYLYSNFGNIGGSRGLSNITGKYQADLLAYGETNLYWDARAFLNDCGVEDSELDAIVDLFIDFSAI